MATRKQHIHWLYASDFNGLWQYEQPSMPSLAYQRSVSIYIVLEKLVSCMGVTDFLLALFGDGEIHHRYCL